MPQREAILCCAVAACVTVVLSGCKRRAGAPLQKRADTAAARAPRHEPGELVAGVRLHLQAKDEHVVGDPIPVSIFAENHTDEEIVFNACYALLYMKWGHFTLEGTDTVICHVPPPGVPPHYDYETAKHLLSALPPRKSTFVLSVDLREIPARTPERYDRGFFKRPGTHTLRFVYDGTRPNSPMGGLCLQPMPESREKEVRGLWQQSYKGRLSSNAVTIRIVDEQTRGEAARSVSDDRPEVLDGIVRGLHDLSLELLAKDTYAPGDPVSVTLVARNRTDREIVLSTFGLLGDCSGSNAIKIADPDGVLYSGRWTPFPRSLEEAEGFLVAIPPRKAREVATRNLLELSGHGETGGGGRGPVENFLKKAGSYRLTLCYNGLGAVPRPGSSREREQQEIPAVFAGRYMRSVWSRPVTIKITDR